MTRFISRLWVLYVHLSYSERSHDWFWVSSIRGSLLSQSSYIVRLIVNLVHLEKTNERLDEVVFTRSFYFIMIFYKFLEGPFFN